MADHDPVLVSAVRTPIGRFLGALSPLTAPQLGAIAIEEAIRRAGIPVDQIDEVIMGNVVSAGVGQAPARQAAMAGVPDDVPAVTINKVCGSGLKAVMLAAQAIKAGDGDLYIAGGMESMSNAPYLLPKARTGYRMGDGALLIRWSMTASGAPSRMSTWAKRPRSSRICTDQSRGAGSVCLSEPYEGSGGHRGRALPGRDGAGGDAGEEGHDGCGPRRSHTPRYQRRSAGRSPAFASRWHRDCRQRAGLE